jgi:hypothetical protein
MSKDISHMSDDDEVSIINENMVESSQSLSQRETPETRLSTPTKDILLENFKKDLSNLCILILKDRKIAILIG